MPPDGSIAGRAATCTMAPEPSCVMCGATAWVIHSAGPRLTSIMSCSVAGVGYLAPDAAGQFSQRILSPVDSHHCEATVGEDRCCGAPERARSDHDRHLGAHDAYLLTAVGVEPNDYERTCPTVGPDPVS